MSACVSHVYTEGKLLPQRDVQTQFGGSISKSPSSEDPLELITEVLFTLAYPGFAIGSDSSQNNPDHTFQSGFKSSVSESREPLRRPYSKPLIF